MERLGLLVENLVLGEKVRSRYFWELCHVTGQTAFSPKVELPCPLFAGWLQRLTHWVTHGTLHYITYSHICNVEL